MVQKKQTYRQGYYTPRNPEKYVGDSSKIVYRSSWELAANQFFDNNPKILRWASEEIKIPYIKPTTGRRHYYYPDYWVEYQDKHGNIIREVIEVKPADQVDPSRKKKKNKYDQLTFAINISKWKAAQSFCEQHGMKFRVLTEEQLFKR